MDCWTVNCGVRVSWGRIAIIRLNLESISEHPVSQSGQWGGGGWGAGTEVEQQMVMDGDWVHFLPSVRGEQMLYREAAHKRPVCRPVAAGGGVNSTLSAPRTPMLTTAGPQQCLQSHLHKRLEVIASLPSAVLRGDETQTDTFTGDTEHHCTSPPPRVHRESQSQIGKWNAV